MGTIRVFLAILVMALISGPATAQRLVSSMSDPEISIDSSFAGETITLFGTVASDFENGDTGVPAGSFDVVIAIHGPNSDRVARLKQRTGGIWINREAQVFRNFPSFVRLLSTSPLSNITDAEVLEAEGLSFEAIVRRTEPDDGPRGALFSSNLIRMMEKEGLFELDERGVTLLSPTFYSARVELPAFVPNGTFLATTFLFQNGEIVARKAERFEVRTAGFERFVGEQAKRNSLVYGLVAVLIALFTGWLGGVLFRR
ncbi:MAG: hypothetical protein GXP01_00870 [Alphaproteobacteria bacterium]|nr:hypothetical protein [Alphaproteobacteria bacterium]